MKSQEQIFDEWFLQEPILPLKEAAFGAMEEWLKQSQPLSSGQQGGDMTARDFFDSPESAITLDLICNPTEKEFLLDMIELYAKGKVRQSLPTPASEGMGEAVKEDITDAHMAGQNSAGCKEPSFSEALAYYQSIQTSSVK